jgi:hypothetical protein
MELYKGRTYHSVDILACTEVFGMKTCVSGALSEWNVGLYRIKGRIYIAFENRVLERMFENRVLGRMFENRVLGRMFENRVLGRMFENRVLGRMFEPESEEAAGH